MRSLLAALFITLQLPTQLWAQTNFNELSFATPGPFRQSLGFGNEVAFPLEFQNRNRSQARPWALVFEGAGDRDLSGSLERLNEASAEILAIIPDRFLFSEGISGSSINDGGDDMYDTGNIIGFDGASISYSDNTTLNRTIGSGNVNYFTRKFEGLFVLSAEIEDIDQFAITGNLGADGAGTVTADEFTISAGGQDYLAFVKRVHDGSDPSINHLILVPEGSGISRSHLTDTNNEHHRINGLSSTRRIHYLLFAKASGGFYPTEIFESIASSFLETVANGPSWVALEERQGTIGAGQSETLPLTLSAAELDPGEYSTRLAIVPQEADPASIPERLWQTLEIQVQDPTIGFEQSELVVSSLAGVNPPPESIRVLPTPGNPQPTTLSVESSKPWLVPSNSTTEPGTIIVTFATGGIPAGSNTAILSVSDGISRRTIEVTLLANRLNVSKIVADTTRPRFYAINSNGKEPGSILVIDSLTREITHNIPVGKEPTDLDLTENGAELLVINTSDPSISRIDLDRLMVTETHQLTEFDDRNNDRGGHVKYGPGNLLYYVDEQWGPRLRVYDHTTGVVLQTLSSISGVSPDTSNNSGFGDIELSPDGSALFGWAQYGDGAGISSSYIAGYSIQADGLLADLAASATVSSSNFRRDPFDTPVLLSRDGSRLVIKDRVIDPSDLDRHPIVYPDEVYSMSPGGEIVCTESNILAGNDGRILHPMGGSSRIQAIAPDYSSLVSSDSNSGSLVWIDLVDTIGAESLGFTTSPPDGGAALNPSRLQWLPLAGIREYQVYLGTDRDAVMNAVANSALFLGSTSNRFIDLPDLLAEGATYYWRAVPVLANGSLGEDAIRSFEVSSLKLSSSDIKATTVAGFSDHRETLEITSPTLASWSLSSNTPWVSFSEETGSTPSSLEVIIDASQLEAGVHSGSIDVTSGATTFSVPLEANIRPLNFVVAKADITSPHIYAISEEPNVPAVPAFLLVIDANSEEIVRAIPVGKAATDLAIHYLDNRIYVTNREQLIIRAFDRDSLEELQIYQIPGEFEGGPQGVDTYKLAAGPAGRLIVQGGFNISGAFLLNTESGEVLVSNFVGQGDTASDPSGRFLYHGSSRSPARIQRFEIGAEEVTETGSEEVVLDSFFRIGQLIVSGDGSLICWNKGAFDANLNQLHSYQDRVRAATFRGDLIFTDDSIFRGRSGLKVGDLPVSTAIQAVSMDQEKLFLFEPSSFTAFDLRTFGPLPSTDLSPSPPDGQTVASPEAKLEWSTDPFARSYDLYFGTSRDAVTNATPASNTLLGTVTGSRWPEPIALDPGQEYFWRVDIRNNKGLQPGEVWTFTAAPAQLFPTSLDLVVLQNTARAPETLEISAPEPTSWIASSSAAWLTLERSRGTTGGTIDIEVDASGLDTGVHTAEIRFTSAGSEWEIPVSVEVLAMDITRLVSDLNRPEIVYALNHGDPATGPSHLFRISAHTGEVTGAIEVGRDANQVEFDKTNDRIFVNSRQFPSTREIDPSDFALIRTFHLETGTFALESNGQGSLFTTRGNINGINNGIRRWDLDSLQRTTLPIGISVGDLEVDTLGEVLYHSREGSSSPVSKIDLSATSPEIVVSTPSFRIDATSPLILNEAGSKVVIENRVFDLDLNLLTILPGRISSISAGAEIAVGREHIWWTDGGRQAASLPFASGVSTITPDNGHLVLVDAVNLTIRSLPLNTLVSLPGPFPRPDQILQESPEYIGWSPVEGAQSYTLTLNGGPETSQVFRDLTDNRFNLQPPLEPGYRYTWQVDATTPTGVIRGTLQSFTISFPEAPPVEIAGRPGIDDIKSIALRGNRFIIGQDDQATIYEFDPATGESQPTGTLRNPGNTGFRSFSSSVGLGRDQSFVTDAGFNGVADAIGALFTYREDEFGVIASDPPFTAPGASIEERLGSSLDVFGDTMMVGTFPGREIPGRVFAFELGNMREPFEEIRPRDRRDANQFGRAIAIYGNEAVVTAPGRGPSRDLDPSAYIFRRNPSTGIWSQRQKITLPSSSIFDNPGTVVAMNQDTIALSDLDEERVHILTRSNRGSWAITRTINRTSVENSTRFFGASLALSDDMLFIADPSANTNGLFLGSVFTFRKNGDDWIQGIPIDSTSGGLGGMIAIEDDWLVVAGSTKCRLFRTKNSGNVPPQFVGAPATQAVSGIPFEAIINAADANQNDQLSFDIVHLPQWLTLSDQGDGSAILSGTPPLTPSTRHRFQIDVRDDQGTLNSLSSEIELLDSSDVPVITRQPQSTTSNLGQEILLHAEATGTGPLTWQWQKDGLDIQGANSSTLNLFQPDFDDSGEYSVIVTNAVASRTSETAVITVAPGSRFAGDWTTMGGNQWRTGHYPATLGRHTFVPAWTTPSAADTFVLRAVIAEGRVFASTRKDLTAYDLETGAEIWRLEAPPSSGNFQEATYYEGDLYFQESARDNSKVWKVDAMDGSLLSQLPFNIQGGSFEAPAVSDQGIFITGGTFGGIYGYDFDTGDQRFFQRLNQADNWTPTFASGQLFAYDRRNFNSIRPSDGVIRWSIPMERGDTFVDGKTTVVTPGAALVLGSGLYCFDIKHATIKWRALEDYSLIGDPSIYDGKAYVMGDLGVSVVDMSTGDHLGDYLVGDELKSFANRAIGQPIIFNDHLAFANAFKTWIFRLDADEPAQVIPVGGTIAYSNGYLIITGSQGVSTHFANLAPEFSKDTPDMIATPPSANDLLISLSEVAEESDPSDTLTWSIVSISRPEIFRGIEIGADTGDLSIIYNPWQSGSSEVVVSMTDSAGNASETSITFTVPALPLPELQLAATLQLNRQTGLYEHTITITNPAAREIAGFDLTITGLPEGVCVNNASDCEGDIWQIEHRQPLAAGASVTLILEYFTPVRGTVLDPQIGVTLVTEPESDPAAGDAGLAVDRCVLLDDGLLIEFNSQPGALYEIQYSNNATDWKVSPVRIRAAGNRVQWIDRGPPRTDAPPSDKSSRFYRVRELGSAAE
ncbi:PQQ-binding-like beta-propeller repeat protein [Haloferula sp.]|uniref:outer membrane protein assembly factor BamB family protein n=1 Tax=Haloferula sp. TaxID=2497595 RepID=UPI003C71877F